MKSLIARTIAAWRAWKASRVVARYRKEFARKHPHIVAKYREIEKKQRRHQATRDDWRDLRRMTEQALSGDA